MGRLSASGHIYGLKNNGQSTRRVGTFPPDGKSGGEMDCIKRRGHRGKSWLAIGGSQVKKGGLVDRVR